MLFARHNAATLAVELPIPKRVPLSQSAYAVLYPDPHDHSQKITFYYSVRFIDGMLSSIVLDDLTGNGDNSQWCNLGYGSILVSSVLALIYGAYPSQGPVSVSGRMSDAGDTSAASNERRRHFWKKMGLQISSSDDERLSGVLGENGLGTLPAIAAENWYDTDVQQETHFTESDIEVVETLWASLLKDGWKALCDAQSEENQHNEQTQRTNSRNWNLLVLGGSVVGCCVGWWWSGTLSVALGATLVGGWLGYHAYMRWATQSAFVSS